MRVALHFPPDDPQHPGAVANYRYGRIEDGVHNMHPLGDVIPLDEFLAELVRKAKETYPRADVRIERLVDNGDGTSRWVDQDEFDAEKHTPVGPGNQLNREIAVQGKQRS